MNPDTYYEAQYNRYQRGIDRDAECEAYIDGLRTDLKRMAEEDLPRFLNACGVPHDEYAENYESMEQFIDEYIDIEADYERYSEAYDNQETL